ncbi:S8/S53 family peptidase [Clostridium aminobutyricum]|uniref:S8/S53 family peptidase n=1 Tax=Clostridium aminobutyricum TaxID=33953 RepID=A0A939DA47_CLOAM|nr:S8/S53 family peptidase [Clostridium aminobutyricum]MBN7773523.1 S8/S53 family peptidase [Clostridium aminobutyricum]
MTTTNPDLLKDIKQQNDYCGVTACHTSGITGKGVIVWDMESYPGSKEHGAKTTQRILDAAPDATVICASPNIVMSETEVKTATVLSDGVMYEMEDFIRKYNIKILTRSVGGSFCQGTASYNFWKTLQDKYRLIILNSMGNEGDEQKTKDDRIAIMVGACGLIKGKPKRDQYSSTGIDIDFIDFRGWDSGTSFSTPYLAGKAALLAQVYSDITHQEAYEYFKANSEDIQKQGFNIYTGYGLPIMRNG